MKGSVDFLGSCKVGAIGVGLLSFIVCDVLGLSTSTPMDSRFIGFLVIGFIFVGLDNVRITFLVCAAVVCRFRNIVAKGFDARLKVGELKMGCL